MSSQSDALPDAPSDEPPDERRLPGQAALGGVLTGLAGLIVALATAAILNERLSPVTAVAEGIAEATPGRLAKLLIDLVGTWDKPILIGGVVVGSLALAALGGRLAERSAWRGRVLFLLLGLLGLLAVLGTDAARASTMLPLLAGTLTWLVVLPVLVPPRPARPADPDPSYPLRTSYGSAAGATDSYDVPGGRGPQGLGRRSFLNRAAVVAGASVAVGVGGRLLGGRRRAVEAARATLDLPVSRGAVPSGAQLAGAGLEDLTPWRTPNGDFYRIDTAFAVPALDVDTWRLRIHGMVEQEVVVDFEELLDRRRTEAWVTLCCVSNPVGGDLIGNAWWSGVRVADLLAEARPLPGADAVLQTSEDGWTCSTPLAALTDERDALLAVAMNGEPLPLEHGYPVRMVVPGLYGYVSATKWLVDIEVTRFADVSAYWTQRGWAEKGPVRTQSRIDVPGANRRAQSGAMRVGGVAWAQHTGIERVEVSLDGGAWTEVELGRVPNVDTWVQWSGTVDVEPGVHTLAVRATDRSGYTQTGVERDVVPDGATGWHTIEFTAE